MLPRADGACEPSARQRQTAWLRNRRAEVQADDFVISARLVSIITGTAGAACTGETCNRRVWEGDIENKRIVPGEARRNPSSPSADSALKPSAYKGEEHPPVFMIQQQGFFHDSSAENHQTRSFKIQIVNPRSILGELALSPLCVACNI